MCTKRDLTAKGWGFVTYLECSVTGERFPPDQVYNLSPAGKPLLVRYDLDAVRARLNHDTLRQRPADMWRWRELLPLRCPQTIVSLGEIETPLVPLARLAARYGAKAVPLVKDEGRLPTGSFKARGLAVAVAKARELGLRHLAMPTNGNAGAALAAYCSRAGLKATIVCPQDTPSITIAEMAIQGADVFLVDGLIDDCGKIVADGREKVGWFDVSTLKEPYRLEGKKTMGFELALQLGFSLPDVILYPTGGGTGLIGMWKAFAELEALGLIGHHRPRMVAVQASGCAPIVHAFAAGERHAKRVDDAHTIASGIRVPAAIGDFLILDALRESGGFAIAVDDEAILAARDEVARTEGLLLCPEGAATWAAYRRAREEGKIRADERVVLFNCASGLKYPLPEAGSRLDRNAPVDWQRLSPS